MFLRKLFSSENKLTWVLIDLMIVIIGVYCAFLIQNYAENEKNLKERNRIVTALKYEMEAFRFQMTEISLGMAGEARKLDQILAQGTFVNFSDSRFIEPQYDYQTIEYGLKLQNSAIVDFDLYHALQALFVEVKKIEHAERLLTETSRRYHTLPDNLDSNSNEFKIVWSKNYDNFIRYIILIKDRGDIAGRIALASTESLALINDRLGSEKAREIEKELIVGYADRISNEKEAIWLGNKYFPHFPKEDIVQMYRQAKGIDQQSTNDSTANN